MIHKCNSGKKKILAETIFKKGSLYKIETKCGKSYGIGEYVKTDELKDLNFKQHTFNILAWRNVNTKTQMTFQENSHAGSSKNNIFLPITLDEALLLTKPTKILKRTTYFQEYQNARM